MRIGRDHIASTVYTIAFATAGAALSVLLLIAIYDRPLLQVLQTEQFAGEVIRTLVGSIGLVLAVPLTTAVGVAVVRASGSSAAPPRRLPAPYPARGGDAATARSDAASRESARARADRRQSDRHGARRSGNRSAARDQVAGPASAQRGRRRRPDRVRAGHPDGATDRDGATTTTTSATSPTCASPLTPTPVDRPAGVLASR